MITTYTTAEGDRLDQICYTYYGTLKNRAVEQVLEANPGLSLLQPELSEGTKIVLPNLTKTTEIGTPIW